jgi:hypothetical protein
MGIRALILIIDHTTLKAESKNVSKFLVDSETDFISLPTLTSVAKFIIDSLNLTTAPPKSEKDIAAIKAIGIINKATGSIAAKTPASNDINITDDAISTAAHINEDKFLALSSDSPDDNPKENNFVNPIIADARRTIGTVNAISVIAPLYKIGILDKILSEKVPKRYMPAVAANTAAEITDADNNINEIFSAVLTDFSLLNPKLLNIE